jgi:hypothetical protein
MGYSRWKTPPTDKCAPHPERRCQMENGKITAETQRTQRNAEGRRGGDAKSCFPLLYLCDLRASAVRCLTVPPENGEGRVRKWSKGTRCCESGIASSLPLPYSFVKAWIAIDAICHNLTLNSMQTQFLVSILCNKRLHPLRPSYSNRFLHFPVNRTATKSCGSV